MDFSHTGQPLLVELDPEYLQLHALLVTLAAMSALVVVLENVSAVVQENIYNTQIFLLLTLLSMLSMELVKLKEQHAQVQSLFNHQTMEILFKTLMVLQGIDLKSLWTPSQKHMR